QGGKGKSGGGPQRVAPRGRARCGARRGGDGPPGEENKEEAVRRIDRKADEASQSRPGHSGKVVRDRRASHSRRGRTRVNRPTAACRAGVLEHNRDGGETLRLVPIV